MSKGKITYVPANIFQELNAIKKQKGLKEQSKAFDMMLHYSQIGREAESIFPFKIKVGRKRNK